MEPQRKPTLYEYLEGLPEGMTGEILNGQLHAQPRPSNRHAHAAIKLGGPISRGYDNGIEGPGGWWVLLEPEVHFVRDSEVAVPDLAGWRRERIPYLPEGHRIEIVPDWVCEILSPSTASKDREIKMPLYAHYGVPYAWLVDPVEQTLEVYGLDGSTWVKGGFFSGTDQVVAPPFEAIRIDLGSFWPPHGLAVV